MDFVPVFLCSCVHGECFAGQCLVQWLLESPHPWYSSRLFSPGQIRDVTGVTREAWWPRLSPVLSWDNGAQISGMVCSLKRQNKKGQRREKGFLCIADGSVRPLMPADNLNWPIVPAGRGCVTNCCSYCALGPVVQQTLAALCALLHSCCHTAAATLAAPMFLIHASYIFKVLYMPRAPSEIPV